MSTAIDDPSLAALLAVVKEAFLREGKWPTRQYVEAVLDQDHYLDLEEVLAGAPRSLIYSTGTEEGSEVVLRVAGLAAAGADREVRRFVQALGWCVDAQLGFRPSSPTATEEVKLEADQFRSEWVSRGEKVSSLDLAKLRAMLITFQPQGPKDRRQRPPDRERAKPATGSDEDCPRDLSCRAKPARPSANRRAASGSTADSGNDRL